ncbi:helix-turn-helix domain-containing protein [Nakamurella sp.]|uniref:helix-turn-helix domain-containing protein n=1 Tax=Nakamurella sp. TaxID=1869182 RepID=UPI003B3BDB99
MPASQDHSRSDHNFIADFAIALQELRAQANFLSFRDLERLTGFSRSALNDAVRGRKVPTYDTARAIVEGYGGRWSDWSPCWRAAVEQAARQRTQRLAARRESPRDALRPPHAAVDPILDPILDP